MQRERGFTLVELLVVFAILALVAALVPAAYDRMREASQYRDAVRTMFSQLRAARAAALSEGRETRFVLDLQKRQYGWDEVALKVLPEPLQLRATVADRDVSSQGEASIRFLPSGGATGGSIEILRAPGVGTRLRVDWLSGRVTPETLLP
ncbi:type II secretion system protein [Pulveribacter suum]|uniref:Type II secretion system protein H n=1 Tax=Pulveribacter suum TaxID=2116657 RepID=A0A2P1NP70_9BURK|nr:prepilin-type N-terminal cleavage/methylation domain-containing protein [Pulveribacter suum]AVP58859.1 type II secretion system protein GspH [Pulveribacter suum]